MSGWTLTFQVINFLVLAALLRRFLFKPVMAMIEKRQEDLARAAAESERVRREAGDLQAQAERALAEMDATRAHSRAETAAIIERDRQAANAEARGEADAIREAARRELEIERGRAAEAMANAAVELGSAIARRLLEQVATPSIVEAFLARLFEQVEALSPERRRELVKDLGGTELLLATAPPLPAADGERWLARINARFGGDVRARLVGDASLVAGAELRFPHTTLSYCWRDGVDAARKELVSDAGAR
jgi:F-type H+-transporting ATPase subunit b